jgi:hypothetical protein
LGEEFPKSLIPALEEALGETVGLSLGVALGERLKSVDAVTEGDAEAYDDGELVGFATAADTAPPPSQAQGAMIV